LKISLSFIVLISFLFSLDLQGQNEFTITGEYQGKDVYIQNPLSNDKVNFCTKEVYLNEKAVSRNPKTSAFAIDLSDLDIGDPILVKIIHHEGCIPKIINPQVIRSKSNFRYLSTSTDAISLNWITTGELPSGKFYIEHYRNKKWIVQKTLEGKGSFETNQYAITPMHHSGDNKYRIKYEQNDGKVFFSRVFEYFFDVEPVSFFPALVTDKITLSRETDYEVVDSYGNQVAKGRAVEIMLPDLASGLYFLHIDNREERFVKK
jgi:hypothetical protein